MKKYFNKVSRGFTLIELLVVIAIIGLLSSVVLASLGSARKKAKDSKRIQSLAQIRTALELYNNAQNSYPTASSIYGNCSAGTAGSIDPANSYFESLNNWLPGGIVGSYISKIPSGSTSDPDYLGCYVYYSDGKDYKLSIMGAMEATCINANSSIPFCGNHILGLNAANSATIFTPGAEAWDAAISKITP